MTERDLSTALKRIQAAQSEEELDEQRVKYLGRNGKLTKALRNISELPEDQRADKGKELNRYKKEIEDALYARREELRAEKLETETQQVIDMTRPGIGATRGRLHPVESLQYDVIRLFQQLGFQVVEGPEIETDWYNFEALNMGPEHPARDTQDTFYLENGAIPRTHTSSVQIRYMEERKPPIRIIAPGKVYRNEDEDSRHSWMFIQVEGLVVDKDISLGDLKGTLEFMLKDLFGQQAQIRLRPDHFPYTEPSIEVDASCAVCVGGGCATCSHTGWIELLGAGMVHPQVLRNVGIDPAVYSGFAFGVGLERLAAIKYGVDDLRYFWRPDLKFLEQF